MSLTSYSDPVEAQRKAFEYLGQRAVIYPSTNKNKKYKIYDPINEKWVNFGQMGYEDFTKHGDEIRRNKYLLRSSGIKGNWRNNPYSPNNLSRNILW